MLQCKSLNPSNRSTETTLRTAVSGFAPGCLCAAPEFHNPNPAPQFCAAWGGGGDFCSRKERPSSPLLRLSQGLPQRGSVRFTGKPSAALSVPSIRLPPAAPAAPSHGRVPGQSRGFSRPGGERGGGEARRPPGRRLPRRSHSREPRDAPGARVAGPALTAIM